MLEFDEYKVKLNNCKPGLDVLRTALNLEASQKEIEELEAASAREGFWNDVQKSQQVQKRLKTLKSKCENYEKLCAAWDDMMTLCEMALEENDESMLEELKSGFDELEAEMEDARLETLLTGAYDANNALMSFHAGAGGTEAQDWCQMLYRMYTRWAERHGFTYKILDYIEGDEAGLKSADILVEGPNAYGFLKSEHGVHRLRRGEQVDDGLVDGLMLGLVEVGDLDHLADFADGVLAHQHAAQHGHFRIVVMRGHAVEQGVPHRAASPAGHVIAAAAVESARAAAGVVVNVVFPRFLSHDSPV